MPILSNCYKSMVRSEDWLIQLSPREKERGPEDLNLPALFLCPKQYFLLRPRWSNGRDILDKSQTDRKNGWELMR